MVPLGGMMFRENEIIILIGAGCSMDADIPASKEMIEKLENLLSTSEWEKYKDFYHFVKSAILYSDGIQGKYSNDFDIERLAIVLGELEKKDNCILYPFIGSWSPKLIETASHEFKIVEEFKRKILEQLRGWVSLEDDKKAEYYKNFFDFQSEYNFSLRIFSLNYDLCFERNKRQNADLERGFDPESRIWDWRRFDPREDYQPSVYLYKLHGSIDWKREVESGNILREVDNIPNEPDLIFGTDYKLQYIDPYLFYTYEFRRYSLESRIILTIGYSFRDEHINGIIKQSLQRRKDRKVVIVSPSAKEVVQKSSEFEKLEKQFIKIEEKAKNFLNELTMNRMEDIIQQD